MMHPHTAQAWIGNGRGSGVIATRPIPKGTIVHVRDALDIVLPEDHPLLNDPLYAGTFTSHAYIEPDGRRVMCWDHGRYMNHCCRPNTLSTGFGFEIAIADIGEGEEITDHYAVLNLEFEMDLQCDKPECLRHMGPGVLPMVGEWIDARIREVLPLIPEVAQPLAPLLDPSTRAGLDRYLSTGQGYPSVLSLQHLGRTA
jgi:hypothetical protein